MKNFKHSLIYLLKNNKLFNRIFNEIYTDFFDIQSIYYLKKYKHKSNEKINVVFLVQLEQLWSKINNVVNEFIKDDNITIYIVLVPTDEKSPLSQEFINFFEVKYGIYSNVILKKVDYENPFDLRILSPNYIFYPRPYDNYLPKKYSVKESVKFSRICLIPYGYNILNYEQEKNIAYNKAFIKYVYLLFVESDYFKSNLENNYKFRTQIKSNKFISLGYPSFEKYVENNYILLEKCKTFLWNPRWTDNKNFGGSSNFSLYYNDLISFFEENDQLSLIFRPHPMAFNNYLNTGIITKEELDNIYTVFSEENNLFLDEFPSYQESFEKADVFISDISSLVPEFFLTGKPVVFCGSVDEKNYSDEFNLMKKSFYIVNSKDDLIQKIIDLSNGLDPLQQLRIETVKSILTKHKDSSARIIDYIKSDFLKGD